MAKSKVICVKKGGRDIKLCIKLSGETLECVKSYIYLGVELTNIGTLKRVQENLYRKASSTF